VRKQTNSPNPRSRRSFVFGLAAAAAAAPELAGVLGAALAPANAAGQQTQTSHSPENDALTELVRLRYGNYLQSADMPILERGLDRLSRSAKEVLKVKIDNGDAPDCLFQPDGR
jgi:hypothetical protein